jgi:3-keto-5-aminohexanoate cleavage enzyme
VKNAMPVDKDVFDYYIKTVERLVPDAEWCAAGIGRHQLTINEWSIAACGHTRTGLEDNIRLDKDRLAPSNAALVKRAAELCEKYERPVADWKKAREILQIPLKAA